MRRFNTLLLAMIFAAMPCWAQFTIPFATGAAKSAGGGAPAAVQVAWAETSGVSQSSLKTDGTNTTSHSAFPSALGANHTLFCAGFVNSSGTAGAFSDTLGLTYTAVTGSPYSSIGEPMYFSTAPTGSGGADTVTFSWTTAGNYEDFGCIEYPTHTTPIVDATCTALSNGTTSVSCSVTTTVANDRIVTYCAGTGGNPTVGTGETGQISHAIFSSLANSQLWEDQAATTTGAYTTSCQNSTAINWGIVSVAIKP